MKKEIYKKIKEYKKIVLARHVGADPDALGSTLGLKDIILNTFKDKEVYAVGVYSSKFKFMGKTDDISKVDISDALLIVLDTPNIVRIDGVDDISKFSYVIKIDHHPLIDDFGDIQWIEEDASSVCQMLIELVYDTRLKMCPEGAKKLFMGVVSDTNRFLFDYTSPKTFNLVYKLVNDTKIEFTKLYDDLYERPLCEVRLQGYIEQNMKVSINGFAYIKLTDEILKKFGVDAASSGNIVNSLNNIKEILVWVIFTEDKKNDVIRVNARSRGPVISKVLEKYGGGGHALASGARLKEEKEIKNVIKDLEETCKNYK
jgi:phosphoesterase RecJ-like protein